MVLEILGHDGFFSNQDGSGSCRGHEASCVLVAGLRAIELIPLPSKTSEACSTRTRGVDLSYPRPNLVNSYNVVFAAGPRCCNLFDASYILCCLGTSSLVCCADLDVARKWRSSLDGPVECLLPSSALC